MNPRVRGMRRRQQLAQEGFADDCFWDSEDLGVVGSQVRMDVCREKSKRVRDGEIQVSAPMRGMILRNEFQGKMKPDTS